MTTTRFKSLPDLKSASSGTASQEIVILKKKLLEDRLVRIEEVSAITCISRSRLYDMISKGKFPAPIKIGARASGWLMSEVQNWIQIAVAARDAGGTKEPS